MKQRTYNHFKAALEDIIDLGKDYDEYESAENLKTLVDDISNVAKKALDLEGWTEILQDQA